MRMIDVFMEWFNFDNIEDAVKTYADAVKRRNGAVQYSLFSDKLRLENYYSFKDLSWITGTSSPWIDSYTIQTMENSKYLIKFYLMTSSGYDDVDKEIVSFEKINGFWKITNIEKF